MFFKKDFLFYLPKIDKYKKMKAKHESETVWKFCNQHKFAETLIENYEIKNFDIIKYNLL